VQSREPRERVGFATLGRAIFLSSLFLLIAGVGGLAEDRDRFAAETGLDVDLVNLVQVDVGGTELTVVFVFINDRTFDSRISASLRAALLPYLGRNALYVNPNVKSIESQSSFDPLEVSIEAGEEGRFTPDLDAWVEITPGFLRGRFEVNPAGASQGSGSEGILILGDAIDPSEPFDVLYRDERATFRISASSASDLASGTFPATTNSHEPLDVPLIEDASALESLLASPDFSAETMAAALGLDPELVRAAELGFMNGEELRFLFVRLEESVYRSALGEDLLASLDRLVGTGAVMVWAYSPTGAGFTPRGLHVVQSGNLFEFWSSASFVDLTEGFARVVRIEAHQLVAGVLRLPSGVDPSAPFSIRYLLEEVSYP
jgi:hypothetical protein